MDRIFKCILLLRENSGVLFLLSIRNTSKVGKTVGMICLVALYSVVIFAKTNIDLCRLANSIYVYHGRASDLLIKVVYLPGFLSYL